MVYNITVIIPCYNCETTLDRAVNSVINQSFGFKNIELILYDDNSTDGTRDIIMEYSRKYENIIPIFSDKNSGFPGKGRNEGIKKSTADYIMFMDNDDEYDVDICKNLFNELNSQECDLVSCGFYHIDDLLKSKAFFNYRNGLEENEKVIFYGDNVIQFQGRLIWCCIFKKEIILENNIWFPEDNLAEDVYFTSMYYLHADKIIYLKNYFGIYRYVQSNSHSNSLNLYKINRLFDIYEYILEIYDKNNIDYSFVFDDRIDITLCQLYLSNSMCESNKNIYSFFERFRSYEVKINFKHSDSAILNFANNLILKKHFFSAKTFLKLLRFIHSSKFTIKIYRLLFNKHTG